MRPLLVILVFIGACAEWPRVGNVPEGDKIEKAGVDPGDLVQIEWSAVPESNNNDQPTTIAPEEPHVLLHGEGLVFEGTLDGVGWADAANAEVLQSAQCNNSGSGTRSPLGAGDYIEDVDFMMLAIAQKGTLCASVEVDATSVGWDLAPRAVAPCNIPKELLADSTGEPVGTDLGGSRGRWAVNVEPGTYAVSFAGYVPNDPDLQVGYAVAFSIVQRRADGSEGVCPTHPEAAQ